MKPLAIATLVLFAPLAGAGEDVLERYDLLLDRYVAAGGVRYEAWRAEQMDREVLSGIVTAFESTDPATLGEADRYALYVNLYNAKTLQLVLEGNPAESIRELSKKRFGFGVFFQKIVTFDGEMISLNALEKRLREESGDPRVHFAVNCASRSCPALLDEPFRGDRLGAQLDERTRTFLRNDHALRVEPRAGGPPLARLSKIFDWYAKDFGGLSGVRRFVREYAPEGHREALEGGFRIAFMEYDWSLNRASD